MRRDEERGFQLYQSDPSGNYGGWKATAIGANKQAAQNLLKQDYGDDISMQGAIKLVIKVPEMAEYWAPAGPACASWALEPSTY